MNYFYLVYKEACLMGFLLDSKLARDELINTIINFYILWVLFKSLFIRAFPTLKWHSFNVIPQYISRWVLRQFSLSEEHVHNNTS